MAVGEDIRPHPFTAFELYFQKFQRHAVPGHGKDAIIAHQSARRQIPICKKVCVGKTRTPDA